MLRLWFQCSCCPSCAGLSHAKERPANDHKTRKKGAGYPDQKTCCLSHVLPPRAERGLSVFSPKHFAVSGFQRLLPKHSYLEKRKEEMIPKVTDNGTIDLEMELDGVWHTVQWPWVQTSGIKSYGPKRIQFASQRTNFFTTWCGLKQGGPVEHSLVLGEDPTNRIRVPVKPRQGFAFVEYDAQ